MGPSGGGKYHHHHHHQQQRGGDDDHGEVKKIYLLQPTARIQPQPHLKGGGFMGGPVQTHIHMTSPMHGRHQGQQHKEQHSEGEPAAHRTSGGGGKSGGHSHESMKILPIVVIPPIAPMPPIQMPASNSVQGARMSLTPQFNNYLVTPASTDLGEKSGPLARHRVSLLQDHKSFSDYGGLAGSSMYRDNYATTRSRLRGRHALRPLLAADYDGLGTRLRYSRYHDELGDDYDVPWSRSTRYSSGRASSGSDQATRRAHYKSQLRANSIRDILDQQALFDDEPPAIEELRESSHDGRSSCCGRNARHYSDDHIYTADTNLDQREPTEVSLQQLDQRRPASVLASSKVRHYDYPVSPSALEDEMFDRAALPKQKEPNYYDKDLELPSRLAGSSFSFGPETDRTSKRLQLNEADLLDDHEWRFDSIKSVAHVSPDVVNTNLTEPIVRTNTTRVRVEKHVAL